GTYEKGNLFLRRERSVNIAGGVSYESIEKNFTAEVNVYRNSIRDFIYRQPEPDSPMLTIVGAFPLMQYRQTNALLSGIDISAAYLIHKQLRFSSRISLLNARNAKTDEWLIMMPADRVTNEISFSFGEQVNIRDGNLSVSFVSVFHPRVPGDGNGKQDY